MRRLPLPRALRPAAWLAAACLVAMPLNAAQLRVAPVTPRIAADDTQASVWLHNTGTTVLHAHVTLRHWQQIDGRDQLTPAQAVQVSPQRLSIAPGAQQRLRIVRMGPAPSTAEESYRLLVEEQPQPDAVDLPLRYSLPVFVLASAPAPAEGALQAHLRESDDGTWLSLSNPGPRHIRVAELGYRDAQGRLRPVAPGLSGYVLPGQRRDWRLPGRAADFRLGRFQAKLDQGPLIPLPLAATPPRIARRAASGL